MPPVGSKVSGGANEKVKSVKSKGVKKHTNVGTTATKPPMKKKTVGTTSGVKRKAKDSNKKEGGKKTSVAKLKKQKATNVKDCIKGVTNNDIDETIKTEHGSSNSSNSISNSKSRNNIKAAFDKNKKHKSTAVASKKPPITRVTAPSMRKLLQNQTQRLASKNVSAAMKRKLALKTQWRLPWLSQFTWMFERVLVMKPMPPDELETALLAPVASPRLRELMSKLLLSTRSQRAKLLRSGEGFSLTRVLEPLLRDRLTAWYGRDFTEVSDDWYESESDESDDEDDNHMAIDDRSDDSHKSDDDADLTGRKHSHHSNRRSQRRSVLPMLSAASDATRSDSDESSDDNSSDNSDSDASSSSDDEDEDDDDDKNDGKGADADAKTGDDGHGDGIDVEEHDGRDELERLRLRDFDPTAFFESNPLAGSGKGSSKATSFAALSPLHRLHLLCMLCEYRQRTNEFHVWLRNLESAHSRVVPIGADSNGNQYVHFGLGSFRIYMHTPITVRRSSVSSSLSSSSSSSKSVVTADGQANSATDAVVDSDSDVENMSGAANADLASSSSASSASVSASLPMKKSLTTPKTYAHERADFLLVAESVLDFNKLIKTLCGTRNKRNVELAARLTDVRDELATLLAEKKSFADTAATAKEQNSKPTKPSKDVRVSSRVAQQQAEAAALRLRQEVSAARMIEVEAQMRQNIVDEYGERLVAAVRALAMRKLSSLSSSSSSSSSSAARRQ